MLKVILQFLQKSLLGSCNIPEKRSIDDEAAMTPYIKGSAMMDHKPTMSFDESMEKLRKIHKSHAREKASKL